jgi:hypothetical protein
MADKSKKEVITSVSDKVMYRLTRRYSDGAETHEAGALLPFVKGGAPKSAVLTNEQEVPELADDDE